MTRCEACPVADGLACRGGVFCEWALGGDPVHLRHIVAVAEGDAGRPRAVGPGVVPCREAAPMPVGAAIELHRRARLCPWRGKASCECGGLYSCAVGNGRRGLVAIQDCLECLQR